MHFGEDLITYHASVTETLRIELIIGMDFMIAF